MTNLEFVAKLKDIAENYTTLYVMGCFGAPMTIKNKARYSNNNDYNRSYERAEKINSAYPITFGFDCVCLVKGVLWGWCGRPDLVYGGAKYKSNDVPDVGTEGILDLCNDVTTDFSYIEPGELVWLKGHVGVYIGDGKVVESTPAWNDGVQITSIGKTGYKSRTWAKHGKLPWIEYPKHIRPEDILLEAEKKKREEKEKASQDAQKPAKATDYINDITEEVFEIPQAEPSCEADDCEEEAEAIPTYHTEEEPASIFSIIKEFLLKVISLFKNRGDIK